MPLHRRFAQGLPTRGGAPVARALSSFLTTLLLATGCMSSSSAPSVPTIPPARTFKLSGLKPLGKVRADRPTTVSFTIRQPDGTPLTDYRRGAGPHTGRLNTLHELATDVS
jgi:hypothetical protein